LEYRQEKNLIFVAIGDFSLNEDLFIVGQFLLTKMYDPPTLETMERWNI
jgi:hypothetical protein